MKVNLIGASLSACALAMSVAAGAQGVDSPGGPGPTTLVAPGSTGEAQRAQKDGIGADFGTGTNILQIPGAAFVARNSSTPITYGGNGYYYWGAAPTFEIMNAAVYLPSGASVSWLDAYVCDTDATNNITFVLRRYTGWTSPGNDNIVSNTPNTSAGCDYFSAAVGGGFFPVPHTVNNDVRYGGGGAYTVVVEGPTTGNSALRFKGVDIWWSRQISPAPAVATFTDVPTSAQFFREIEALANSGITSGCTATTFCPDTPVTRRQMAAFLSRALGLSYQY